MLPQTALIDSPFPHAISDKPVIDFKGFQFFTT